MSRPKPKKGSGVVLYVTVLEATDLAGPLVEVTEWLPGLRKNRKPPAQLEMAVHLTLQLGTTVWRTSDIIMPGLPGRSRGGDPLR